MTRRSHDPSSPDSTDSATLIKRLKTAHVSSNHTDLHASRFAAGLLDHTAIARLHASYLASDPFKYAVVEKLFQDDLLQKVKDECMSELNFTEKETDIYKVNQTGDLASLDFLSEAEASRLSNLHILRDALYSSTFRAFLQAVTGCGPLSGKKQDMSVNSYTRGCHLLNHDDVIGTRRVSYILYMPLPNYQMWQRDWGGALELYPVKTNEQGDLEPESAPSKIIPPSWNQFIFFEVQPGRSFHSVEEVVVGGEGEDGRARLSISGWFHAAQEGEEGYIPEPPKDIKSSREQLFTTSTLFNEYPSLDSDLSTAALSDAHTSFLSEFLNPVYLQPRTMKALASRFAEESSLELHSLLCKPLADALEPRLRELDLKDGLGDDRAGRIPPHSSGTYGSWTVKGPPHKWRYSVLKPQEEGTAVEAVFPRAAYSSADQIMRALQDELFPSPAFRAWIAIVSRLMPIKYSVEARRFRPGLDYTLATSEEKEVRLDVVLGLTPNVSDVDEDGSRHRGDPRGWEVAEWGGWECYMAPHNEEDDPAVYRSSTHKKHKVSDALEGEGSGPEPENPASSSSSAHEPKVNGDKSHSPEPMEEEEEEEDSTLLTVQPGFNRLLLVLRDERVMRFVKYVSAAAEGSRWDVCGEYEVGMLEEEDQEEES